MRYPSSHSRSPARSNNSYFYWTLIAGVIIVSIFLVKYFLGDGQSGGETKSGLTVSGSGKIVITDAGGKKRDVTDMDIFSSSDSSLSIISGVARITGSGLDIWADRGSELSYDGDEKGGKILSIDQGRSWIEADQDSAIRLKHIRLGLNTGDIALVEQQRIYSIAYALRGSSLVTAGEGQNYTLEAGRGIKVSQSDLINPGFSLASLSDVIDDSIKQNPFFIARNGQEILSGNILRANTGSTLLSTGSGLVIPQSVTSSGYITITSPADGGIIGGTTVKVEGKVQSTAVTRVMINDTQVTINKQNQAFSLVIPFEKDSLDIVYKAYNDGGNLLERGVLTLYSQDKKQGSDKLVPTTFPNGDKNFRILSPAENPYKTTLSAITVSGSVPKSTVEYITVNNFRLKKFIPNSTTWYYYANTAYGTMKEGFNLYEIKFYDANNVLLSSQLFTIIKEGGISTLSGE